jgi:hypothetical protein
MMNDAPAKNRLIQQIPFLEGGMRSVINEAARRVQAAHRRPGFIELASFEELLGSVRQH